MSVSTVFLQTTEDNGNTFADTTFHIDLPMLQPTYKLSVATFMFRPVIILGEQEYMKVRFTIDRDLSFPLNYPDVFGYKFTGGDWGDWEPLLRGQVFELAIPIGQLPYNSAFDTDSLTSLLTKKIELEQTRLITDFVALDDLQSNLPPDDANHTYKVVGNGLQMWYYDEKSARTSTVKLSLEIAFDLTDTNRLEMYVMKPLVYHDNNNKCYWNLTSFEITELSPALARLTGITSDVTFTELNKTMDKQSRQVFYSLMRKPFNPQYWNYITLTCNKVYNTASIVNQTHYNVQPNEATEFYKCQIMGYMVNQSPMKTYITTGAPTANEYLITPSDFNSIRFNLHYDNGEPVMLYSPMTIVLNISPV